MTYIERRTGCNAHKIRFLWDLTYSKQTSFRSLAIFRGRFRIPDILRQNLCSSESQITCARRIHICRH